MSPVRLKCAGMLTAVVLAALPSAAMSAQSVTVFSAASLKNALEEAGHAYTAKSGIKVVGSCASSSTLAKQIENGAPADAYLSANVKWMDYLQQRDAIDTGTRINLLRNRLVLIAPGSSRVSVRIQKGFPIARLLGDGRLAMADPDHVPAGIYGKAALALFQTLEQKAYDRRHGGYVEFFTEDWRPLTDPKEPGYVGTTGTKTYNTHLHLLEAFAELYRVGPDPLVGRRLNELIEASRERRLSEQEQKEFQGLLGAKAPVRKR